MPLVVFGFFINRTLYFKSAASAVPARWRHIPTCSSESRPPAPKFSPVFSTKRFSPTWLVEFPLNKLFVLIPFKEKLLLVSRLPFAKIAWLPSPALVPAPPKEIGVHPRTQDRQLRKAPRAERRLLDNRAVHHVAVRCVRLVHQRRARDRDRRAPPLPGCSDELTVAARSALHHNLRVHLGLESIA